MRCNGVKMVEMGLVEARGCLRSLGWSQHFRGRCWCSTSTPVLPAAAPDCHHGNASCAQVVVCCDTQHVLGWAAGVCTPWGNQPPRTQTKIWGPLHRMGRRATKPSGSLGAGVLQGDTVAQAGAWPGDSVVRERRVKPFGVTVAVVAPSQRALPHPKPIIKDDVRGGRGEVT